MDPFSSSEDGYDNDEQYCFKRTRTTMSNTQHNMLLKVFEMDQFPSTEVREDIARKLMLKPRTVQIWFQNQRQKMKIKTDAEKYIGVNPISNYIIPNFTFKSKLDILADIAYEEYLKYMERRKHKNKVNNVKKGKNITDSV